MECPPTRAEAWLEEHAQDLLGLGAGDASALVEGAGLGVRVVTAVGGWVPEELRNDRITVRLGGDDTVGSVDAG